MSAIRKVVERLAMPVLRYATRSYITGPNLEDAIDLAKAVKESGFSCTICYWNDGKEDPRLVADRYLKILDSISEQRIDGYLAVKMPALLDSGDLAAEVVIRARVHGIKVMFDSHSAAQADNVFETLERVGEGGVGCAIPGRWHRSLQDTERAIELGASVRVVKGQWPDPQEPDMDMRAGFLRIIDRLAGRAAHVSVATHDAQLACESIRRLQAAGTSCEQELVYPLPIAKAFAVAQAAGVGTRLYIPYGTAWLPYSVSRAMKNPTVILWLIRDIFTNKRFRPPSLPQKRAG